MWVLVLLIALLIGLALLASIANSAATYNAAQAAVEASRAAQIAAAGQTAANLTAVILAVLLALVVVAAALAIAWLLWRDRRRGQIAQSLAEAPQRAGRWAPGPNARFQRQEQPAALERGADLNQVVMALLVSRLLDPPAREALPRPAGDTPGSSDPWRW